MRKEMKTEFAELNKKTLRYLNVKVLTENDKFFNIGMIPTRGTSDSVECLRLIEIRLIVCLFVLSHVLALRPYMIHFIVLKYIFESAWLRWNNWVKLTNFIELAFSLLQPQRTRERGGFELANSASQSTIIRAT